ncbi:transcriptional regulator, partial [Streptomyces sp. TRM76130]|nr:transcriptional regulator [Streptomyces sp. TRM76130]
VANLRAVAGADPDSAELTALVGELVVKSQEFARLWERYDVCERGGGRKTFRHPRAGTMTLTYEIMSLARTGGQRMVVYQAAPGTPDEEAVLRLESADARPERTPAGHPEPTGGPRPAPRPGPQSQNLLMSRR